MQYCATDMVAALCFIRALGEVSLGCDDPAKRYAEKLEGVARVRLVGFNLERVTERAEELRRVLPEPD